MSVTFAGIVECWAIGYGAMLTMMVIACLAANRKLLRDLGNWVILVLLSILSWLGFAFILVVFCIAYIEYIKNKDYDKDSEK